MLEDYGTARIQIFCGYAVVEPTAPRGVTSSFDLSFKQVTVEGDRYVEQRDEEGGVRQFAVKRMPWDIINQLRERMLEVSFRISVHTRCSGNCLSRLRLQLEHL